MDGNIAKEDYDMLINSVKNRIIELKSKIVVYRQAIYKLKNGDLVN